MNVQGVQATGMGPIQNAAQVAAPHARARALYATQAESVPGIELPEKGAEPERREIGFRIGPLGVFYSMESQAADEEHLIRTALELARAERAGRNSRAAFAEAMDVADTARSMDGTGSADTPASVPIPRRAALRAYTRLQNDGAMPLPGRSLSLKA